MKAKLLSVSVAGFLIVATLPGCSQNLEGQSPSGQATSPASANVPKYRSDRLLVRFRAGVGKAVTDGVHARQGTSVLRTFSSVRNLQVVRLPKSVSVKQKLTEYRKEPDVLYAEPDYTVHTQENSVTPNDLRFAELWGLHNTGQNGGRPGADIHAPEAWAISTGSDDVVVGVIDTGVDYTHPDLAANIFRNEAECNPNGLDDDANGYADDCHGIDTTADDSDPMDLHGHGTHVAGTIGAAGNNALGVVGVNWHVKVLPCRFLSATGIGFISDAIACLDYMAVMKQRGVNLVATNNSWGGGGYSQALEDAIAAQWAEGVLFVVAAGNNGSDNDSGLALPANTYLPNVISVAATDASDELAYFSQFGSRSVHLGAPGVGILSTVPGGEYRAMMGTSMATPHVTGVAALLKAQDPSRNWRMIKNLILAGTDAVPALRATITGGRLNAYRSLTCTDRHIQARLLPRPTVTAVPGYAVTLAALNIACGLPAGNVVVTVSPGEPVTLTDDGSGPDQQAGDGIYSGEWIAPAPGTYTLGFPGESVVVQVLAPYTYRDVPLEDHSITGTPLGLSTSEVAELNPPFPIQYGGGLFDKLYIGGSGSIGFTGGVSQWVCCGDDALPLTERTQSVAAFVLPWSGPLTPGGSPENDVYWGVRGVAPSRELVIEWRNVTNWGGCKTGEGVTFQAIFYEEDSRFRFQYPDTVFGGAYGCAQYDHGRAATVGVQVALGVAVAYKPWAETIADGAAILWTAGGVAPKLERINPFTAAAGGGDFGLTLWGQQFLPTTRVEWNGDPRPTRFSSSRELVATIPAGDIAIPSTASIRASTPEAGSSASLPMTVVAANPIPHLAGITALPAPSGVLYTTNSVESGIELRGSDFVSGATAAWNGQSRPTQVISSSYAIMFPRREEILIPDTAAITVENPVPGGGVSNAVSIEVTNPRPMIFAILPESLRVGDKISVWVLGTFARDSVVRWNGAERPTIYSAGVLVFTPEPQDVAAAGDARLEVFTRAPGGGLSDPVVLHIAGIPDFAITVAPGSSTSATAAAGGTATFNLLVAPVNEFAGVVSFSCGGVPQASQCTISPNPANVSGAAATSITVTISTTKRSATTGVQVAGKIDPRLRPSNELILVLLALAVAPLRRVRRRTRVRAAFTTTIGLLATLLIACGGGRGTTSTSTVTQFSGTPAGTYTITIVAASGGVTHSMPLTLTVN